MKPWRDFEATLEGITFWGDVFDYRPGFYVTDVTGLSSGAAVTYSNTPSSFGPGVYDSDNRREDARVPRIQGFAYGRNATELGALVDQFGALLVQDDAVGEFSWTEYGAERRRIDVRRFGTPEVIRDGSSGFADFTLSLRASDQRVYGEPLDTGWGQTVEGDNRGAYPAPVVLEVRGNSGSGWTAYGPRDRLVIVTTPVTPGTTHQYDGDTGLLMVGGTARTTGVTRSDMFEMPPGHFTITVSDGCEIRAHYASTWAP